MCILVHACTRALSCVHGDSYLEAEGMHRTWRFKQSDIAENVDRSAARKVFDLSLKEFGPYCMDFDRSGRCVPRATVAMHAHALMLGVRRTATCSWGAARGTWQCWSWTHSAA